MMLKYKLYCALEYQAYGSWNERPRHPDSEVHFEHRSEREGISSVRGETKPLSRKVKLVGREQTRFRKPQPYTYYHRGDVPAFWLPLSVLACSQSWKDQKDGFSSERNSHGVCPVQANYRKSSIEVKQGHRTVNGRTSLPRRQSGSLQTLGS